MKLEFKVYSVNEESIYYNSLIKAHERTRKAFKAPIHFLNEFIVVGEDDENYRVHQLDETGLSVFGGCELDLTALSIPKSDFKWDGTTYVELDIPKICLTIDIIDKIKELNS